MSRYWKSPFGKNFRRAGYPWGYFGESVQGYVRNFYRRRYRTPLLEPLPPHVQTVADKLENLIRRVQAQRGIETKRRKAEVEKAARRAAADVEETLFREPRLQGFQ